MHDPDARGGDVEADPERIANRVATIAEGDVRGPAHAAPPGI